MAIRRRRRRLFAQPSTSIGRVYGMRPAVPRSRVSRTALRRAARFGSRAFRAASAAGTIGRMGEAAGLLVPAASFAYRGYKAAKFVQGAAKSMGRSSKHLDAGIELANSYAETFARVQKGFSKTMANSTWTARSASGPDDSPILSPTQTTISVLTKHSRSARSGNRTGLPGKHFKTEVKLGGKLNRKWLTLMKQQGVGTYTSYDTVVDSSSDVVGSISTRRKQLTTNHGFNQKTGYFLEIGAYPRLTYPMLELAGSPSILSSTAQEGNIKVYGGVMGTTGTHTFANLNNQLPVFIKVYIVMPQNIGFTAAFAMPKMFGTIAGSQTQNAIPYRYLQQDITGSETNWFAGYVRTDPRSKLSYSALWRRIYNVATTKLVKLEPNDIWTLTIKDVYKNGLDILRAAATLNDSAQANETLREQYPMNYMIYVEHWGPKVDAVEFVTDDGNIATRGMHIGSAPGSITRESKLTWSFCRPKSEVNSSTGAITAAGPFEYYVTRINERSDKAFYRNFSNVGKPGEAGVTLYVPFESDTTTKYADTVMDDTAAGD